MTIKTDLAPEAVAGIPETACRAGYPAPIDGSAGPGVKVDSRRGRRPVDQPSPGGGHRSRRGQLRRAGRHRARHPRGAHARATIVRRPAAPADPQRSVGNIHPVWTYAHVPNGFSGDTEAIIAQIERFALASDRSSGRRFARPPKWPTTRTTSEGTPATGPGHPPLTFAPDHAVALHDRHSGHVHLLGGHTAGPGHGMCAAPTPQTSPF